MFKRIITLLLAGVIIFTWGCTKTSTKKESKAQRLEGATIEQEKPTGVENGEDMLESAMGQFAFELLKNCDDAEGNILISPASVAFALGMTANGASGDTLKEMENVLGEKLNIDLINEIYYKYATILESSDECKLSIANSIWLANNPQLQVKDAFLTKCLTYYEADVYMADFDENTVTDVNNWVSDKTDGMIDKIIKQFYGNELMLLINAIAFEAEWEYIYYEHMVRDVEFTTAKGMVSEAEGMYSEENVYISDENTEGFIKDYKGNYRFVALLPKDGVDIDDYVEEFSEEKYQKLIESQRNVPVDAMLPKFSYAFESRMVSPLINMGMEQAFEMGVADFSNMASFSENIYIGDVIHKTYIEVAEKGTKAAAVTAVIMDGNSVEMVPEEIKEVHLDRPFMYVIIDDTTNLPLFVGVVREI